MVAFEYIKDSLRQSKHELTTPGGRKMRRDGFLCQEARYPDHQVGIETVQTELSCSVKNSLSTA